MRVAVKNIARWFDFIIQEFSDKQYIYFSIMHLLSYTYESKNNRTNNISAATKERGKKGNQIRQGAEWISNGANSRWSSALNCYDRLY
jgi:hypothetical protein